MRAERNLALTAGLVAITGLSALAGAGGAAGSGVTGPSRNRTAARRDAAALLGKHVLSVSAVRSSREPVGDAGLLARPPVGPATPNVVDLHAWWRVGGPASAVLSIVEAHPPAGSRLTGSGATSGPHGRASAFVIFAWPGRSGVLSSRQLVVEVAALRGGSTGVREDAQVIWITPRAASERVPAGVHEVDVTRAPPGQSPSLSRRVTDSALVGKLISMIDALPIVQPGAFACPAYVINSPIVTFTFRATPDGPALAQASERADVTEPTTACDSMTFSIRGRAQTPLLSGGAFLGQAQQLLGVRLRTAL